VYKPKPRDTLGVTDGGERLGRSERNWQLRCATRPNQARSPPKTGSEPRGPGTAASVTSPKYWGKRKVEPYNW